MTDTSKLSDISSSMLQYIYLVRCAFREIWRSSAFKISAGLGTFLFQCYYLLCVQYQHLFAVFSPTLGFNNTIFFFGYLPTYFILLFQISAVVFALLAFVRVDRNPELLSRPCRNSDILFGCANGATILLFAVVLVNVALILASATLVSTFDTTNANVPAVVPAINFLLFDMFPTLFFWSSFSLLVVVVVRSTIVAFALTSIAATSLWLLTLFLPIDWTVVFSSYSYSSMVVSDMATRWSESAIVINRVTVLFAAFGFYVLASYLWQRRDHEPKREILSGALALMASVCVFGSQVLNIQASEEERGNWVQAHGEFRPHEVADLVSIEGLIEIDPGNRLALDLDLTFNTPTEFNASELIFSFNPSMSIERLTLNGAPAVFTFRHGILAVQYDRSLVSVATDNVLSIRASGIPDANFGYLEPAIDYLHSPGMSAQTRKLFGTHNSIFDDQFVALMPGSKWYPTPGPLSVDKYSEALLRAPDLFDVTLTVSISEQDWTAAGPGSKIRNAVLDSTFTFETHTAIPHFALLASKFESRVVFIGDMTIELLIHESHVDGIKPLRTLEGSFKENLARRFNTLMELGIQFKNPRITFVETPNYLRTVSGYGMSFVYSLPGVVLVKESSIPLWNMEKMQKRLQKYLGEGEELASNLHTDLYLFDQRNVVGGNLEDAIAAQLHPYSYKQFDTDNVALNYLRQMLITVAIYQSSYLYRHYDAEMASSFATRTIANPIAILDRILGTRRVADPTYLEHRMREYSLARVEPFKLQSSVLRDADLLDDTFEGRRILSLRIRQILRALSEMYGEEQLHQLVAPLHEPTYADSIDYIYRSADRLNLDLGPFLHEWWTTNRLPSFRVSRLQSNMVSVEESDLTHQVSFDIRNDSDSHGVVQIYSTGESHRGNTNRPSIVLRPKTSHRINLYGSEPFRDFHVDTFHSRNNWIFRAVPAPSTGLTHYEIKDLTEPSYWQPANDEYIVVDNLDPGTELIDHSYEGLDRSRKIRGWFNLIPRLRSIRRNGIEYDVPLLSTFQLDYWGYSELRSSYGKYWRSTLSTYNETAPTVRFKAMLPTSGQWKLEYHFPHLLPYWRQYGQYEFVLRDNETDHAISLNAEGLHGWIGLGSFDLIGPEVHLDLIAVEPGDSFRVADAIRWKRSDE